ncbi:uncharacterized protein BJX67DRAFT_167070 [Aspergillus lucknowensis]|uniref:Uncharacterized protein n=1 Tax=Aspergillus lucknowensis TaxID=176173 RepID=A0ABR4M4Y9_9EURO
MELPRGYLERWTDAGLGPLGTETTLYRRDKAGDRYDSAHLSQLIAALGPPPRDFLAKTPTGEQTSGMSKETGWALLPFRKGGQWRLSILGWRISRAFSGSTEELSLGCPSRELRPRSSCKIHGRRRSPSISHAKVIPRS